MELSEVVRRRRMVRVYDPDRPVPEPLLARVLQAAIRAPSAGFTQGWDFLVLDAAADRELFWATTTDPQAEPDGWLRGMRTAPVLILCLSDPERYLDRYAEPDKGWDDRDPRRWPIPYWDVDTGMAALLMLLTAADADLGGCFFGVPGPDQPAVLAAFGVPADRRVVGVVSLGYPAAPGVPAVARRRRRPVSEVAHHGRFGTGWPRLDEG